MEQSSWPDLPPDVLRDISGCLSDAVDFLRFHAVCRPWRDSSKPIHSLRPWLLATPENDSVPLRFRCVLSKSSYRATPQPLPAYGGGRRIWLSTPDAAALRYITIERLRPSLHDRLTGAITRLPLLPPTYCVDGQWEEKILKGAVYLDGTTFLYGFSIVDDGLRTRFRAALLLPGETEWKLVERNFENTNRPREYYYARRGGKVIETHIPDELILVNLDGEYCATYRGGKILVTVEPSLWRIITPGGGDDEDVLVPTARVAAGPCAYLVEHYGYILESRGELLWASVQIEMYYSGRLGELCVLPHSVLVHVLEEDYSRPEKTRWVKKDGHILADRVLFLGSPSSFAVDASMLGGHGGCAYFVYHNDGKRSPAMRYGALQYNLLSEETRFLLKAEFIERLPQGWDGKKCTWLVPQPALSPIKKSTKRSRKARVMKQQQQLTSPTHTIHIERDNMPCFKLLVRNLLLTVKSPQLQLLFSNYGKVSSAKVIYHKKAKRSQGIAHVTMSTVHAHPEDALDALTNLVLDGTYLEVSFIKKGHRRRRRLCIGNNHSGFDF